MSTPLSRRPRHAARSEDEPSGLIAWLEQTRVQLPLKAVDCRFRVLGGLADIELDQVFHQNNPAPLDVLYTFPLPDGAAVYRCEMIINDRVVRAKVMPEDQARDAARKAKSEGRRVALTESVRPNLFELQLGNVQPQDLVIIRFAFFQLADTEAGSLRLRIPLNPGVRYIPGKPLLRANKGKGTADDTDEVPDASRLSPPRIGRLHPDAAALSVTGEIDPTGVNADSVSSPTHMIVVKKTDAEAPIRVSLSPVKEYPDRDFVVLWKDADLQKPLTRAWTCETANETFAFVRLRAPEADTSRKDPLDLWILLDRSGSMEGRNWPQAVAALQQIARQSRPDDRFWITFFESDFADFAERPMTAAELLADPNFLDLESLGADGGTELLPAFEHLCGKHREFCRSGGETRRSAILLITDGQVGNEERILHLAKKGDLCPCPIHCFGIDEAVNDAFLRSLARIGGGSCHLLTPDDDLTGPVADLVCRLGAPVLTGLRVPSAWSAPGGRLPDLHSGQSLFVTLRCSSKNTPLTIEARRGLTGKHTPIPLEVVPARSDAPRLLYAKETIETLIEAGETDKAVSLAVSHGLACRGASFIAIDEAEKVPVALSEIYQPSFKEAFSSPAAPARLHAAVACYAAPPRQMFSFATNAPAAPAGLSNRKVSAPPPAAPKPAPPVRNFEREAAERVNTWVVEKLSQLAPDLPALNQAAVSDPVCVTMLKDARKTLPSAVSLSIIAFLLKWALLPGCDKNQRLAWIRGLITALRDAAAEAEPDLSSEDRIRIMLDASRDYHATHPLPSAGDNALISELLSLV